MVKTMALFMALTRHHNPPELKMSLRQPHNLHRRSPLTLPTACLVIEELIASDVKISHPYRLPIGLEPRKLIRTTGDAMVISLFY